jgi:hypothetical protein
MGQAANHVVVPWAVSLFEPCQQALPQLDDVQAFPHLHALLGKLVVSERLEGDEYALAAPHERLWARQQGWAHGAEAVVPWAARLAQLDGLPDMPGQAAWGLLTPCHWAMGHDHLTFTNPESLELDEAASRALLAAIAPLFEEDGWQVHWGHPTRWYVQHPSLSGLPTASLDRVIGRNPDLWMPEHPQARLIKRLQSEVQMLLYEHPINEARQAQGLQPVNTFWLSGCGALPAPPTPAAAQALWQEQSGPRAALLQSDVAQWLAAWRALEHTTWPQLLAQIEQGQAVRLSLCGERHAVTLRNPPPAAPGLGQTLARLGQRAAGVASALGWRRAGSTDQAARLLASL